MLNTLKVENKYRLFLFAILLWNITDCVASGWNDYVLDIGDGYTINRCNSLDISLSKDDSIILSPYDFDQVGPIKEYFIANEFIFTKNLGREPRNLFEGDEFEDIDPSREFFFIVHKNTGKVTGPFSNSEFREQPSVKTVEFVDWKNPKNPNIFMPLLGSIIVLIIWIRMLAIRYLWITIPVLFLILLFFFHFFKKNTS